MWALTVRNAALRTKLKASILQNLLAALPFLQSCQFTHTGAFTKAWQLICLAWARLKVLMKPNLVTCIYFGWGCFLHRRLPILPNLSRRKGAGSYESGEEGKANQTCSKRETSTAHVSEVGQVQGPCLLREGIKGGVSTSAVIIWDASNPSPFLWNLTHLETRLAASATASWLKDGKVSAWLEFVIPPAETEKNFVGINPRQPSGICQWWAAHRSRLPGPYGASWLSAALQSTLGKSCSLLCDNRGSMDPVSGSLAGCQQLDNVNSLAPYLHFYSLKLTQEKHV